MESKLLTTNPKIELWPDKPNSGPHEDPVVGVTFTGNPVANAIEIRKRLKSSVNLIDSATWAKWRGVKSKPPGALGKYKRHGRIFAVRSGDRDLYPAFQFKQNAEPREIVREILRKVPKEAWGWSLLSWFEARNALLKGATPSESLASDPAAVLRAAARFYSREE